MPNRDADFCSVRPRRTTEMSGSGLLGSNSTTLLVAGTSSTMTKAKPGQAPSTPSKGPTAEDVQETMAEMAGETADDNLVGPGPHIMWCRRQTRPRLGANI